MTPPYEQMKNALNLWVDNIRARRWVVGLRHRPNKKEKTSCVRQSRPGRHRRFLPRRSIDRSTRRSPLVYITWHTIPSFSTDWLSHNLVYAYSSYNLLCCVSLFVFSSPFARLCTLFKLFNVVFFFTKVSIGNRINFLCLF